MSMLAIIHAVCLIPMLALQANSYYSPQGQPTLSQENGMHNNAGDVHAEFAALTTATTPEVLLQALTLRDAQLVERLDALPMHTMEVLTITKQVAAIQEKMKDRSEKDLPEDPSLRESQDALGRQLLGIPGMGAVMFLSPEDPNIWLDKKTKAKKFNKNVKKLIGALNSTSPALCFPKNEVFDSTNPSCAAIISACQEKYGWGGKRREVYKLSRGPELKAGEGIGPQGLMGDLPSKDDLDNANVPPAEYDAFIYSMGGRHLLFCRLAALLGHDF